MKNPKFVHDAIAHTYHLDGLPILSTTDVLEDQGLCNYGFIPEANRRAALSIGKDVEQATLLYDQGKNWSKRYAHVAGFVLAWECVVKKYQLKAIFRETPLLDPIYRYATRPDFFGESIHGLSIWQIKTGPIAPFIKIQTAAEERAAYINGDYPRHDSLHSTANRFGVELCSDSTYKVIRFDHPGYENDIRIFLNALSVAQWKRNNGL